MDKITIHTTDLDSFEWYKRIEDMPTEEMIGRLLRTEPPNENMLAGIAFHSIMENPPDEFSDIERDGFHFIIECDMNIILPQRAEIRYSKKYMINGIEVTVIGKCDGITGNKLYDHKLTFNPKPENYLESQQWRSYLDIFNADVFEYYIYAAKWKNDLICIYDISSMKVYRYPELLKDLEKNITELVSFIQANVPKMIQSI